MADASGQGEGNHSHPKKRLKALAEYVLGEGQQPIEAILSVVREAFNCRPSEAMGEDMALISRILEARMLDNAKTQHNEDATKLTEAQMKLWLEAMEAVNG